MWPTIESPEPQFDLKPAARVTPRLRTRPRPKSACSVRPRRPRPAPRPFSALGLRHHETHDEIRVPSRLEGDEDFGSSRRRGPTPVAQYQRCLKLLGLVPSDGDTHRLPDEDTHRRPDTKNAKARVKTFVVRRTVSQDDVRDAVLKDIERSTSGCEKHHDLLTTRRILAKAVYEEWYFNKMEASQKYRRQQCLQKRTEQWHQMRIKRERCEKSIEKFTEWVKKKNEQLRKERQMKNKAMKDAHERKKIAEASYNAWKVKKMKF